LFWVAVASTGAAAGTEPVTKMGRQRGRTTGTLLIGALVLTAILYSFFGERHRTMPSPVMKAEVSQLDSPWAAVSSQPTEVGSVSASPAPNGGSSGA
jgi:cytochrome c oxidase assembly factor CtaG